MFNFVSKSQPAFGLDVSSGSIKIMEFAKTRSGLGVKAYGSAPLPKGVIIGDAITDHATFQHMVTGLLQKPQFGKVGTRHVVTNLPETKSFVRVIQIPKMSEAEAEGAVPFEAENFIPLPIDQVYLDWQKVSDAGDKMNILIIASPKEFVDLHLSALEKCGLVPVALEVESQSCQRCLVAPDSQETSLIVDMSEMRSSLIMVETGALQFTSTIPIAGSSLTEALARALGVSTAKAELIKQKVGLDNTAEYPNVRTTLMPVLNNFVEEIKNILRFHNEHSTSTVAKIILTGGTSMLKGLPDYLQASLADVPGLKVELGNPWLNVPGSKTGALDPGLSQSYSTAIGLALRGIS